MIELSLSNISITNEVILNNIEKRRMNVKKIRRLAYEKTKKQNG